MLTHPARLCRPWRLAGPAHAAATAGFSIQKGEIPRETDCLLEGNGFELQVPRRHAVVGGLRYRSRGGSLYRDLEYAGNRSRAVAMATREGTTDADPLRGQNCSVSGAGHGFGRCIAETFTGLGARVFGCDLSGAELAETAKSGVMTEIVDLTDRVAAAAWIARIEAVTGTMVDVLVNNAGGVAGQEMRSVEDVSDDDWDRIFAINVGAAFVLSRAVATGMKRAGRGRIINISSGAGLAPSLTSIQAYYSAKHAVVGLTRQLAHEMGQFGITVNSVAPGFVRTNEATEKQWVSDGADGQKALVERIAMKRLGTAQDIANAVVFFASELASFVNGQVLQVDGGK